MQREKGAAGLAKEGVRATSAVRSEVELKKSEGIHRHRWESILVKEKSLFDF
jgi:hypothetical protein